MERAQRTGFEIEDLTVAPATLQAVYSALVGTDADSHQAAPARHHAEHSRQTEEKLS